MEEKIKQYDEEGRVIRTNRTQEKKEREKLKDFVQELLLLPSRQYSLLPIDERLQEALILGKRLSGNALKRHLSFLCRLVDEQGEEEIRSAHEKVNHQFVRSPQKQKTLQNEVERLFKDEKETLNLLFEKYADFDIQYVRQLLRQSKKEQEKQKDNPEESKVDKYQKQLLKYLAQLSLN